MGKIEAFYQIVHSHFKELKRDILIDACCGNGDAGVRFSAGCKKTIFLDIRSTRNLAKNLSDAEFEFELCLEGIDSFDIPGNAVIIAVHSCGGLADRLLEKAISARTPVAVMPCCYNPRMRKYDLSNPPDRRKLMYEHEKDYYDAFRMQYLRENGFSAYLERISQKITPMNNVLIGIPLI